MAQLVIPDWQHRRARFNHDWLKNQFLPALGKLLNVLDGHVQDATFKRTFPEQTFSEWDARLSEAAAIVAEFEAGMSPRTFLSATPLCELATSEREWLSSVVHDLWLARCGISRTIQLANEAVAKAGTAFAKVRQAHADRPADQMTRDAWSTFRERCWDLTRAIEQFPSEVKFT